MANRIDAVLVADEVSGSKKYGSVDRTVIDRVCADAAARSPNLRDAVKSAKNELHIIHESFLSADCHRRANALLDDAAGVPGADLSRAAMELHMSTRERLCDMPAIADFLDSFIDESSSVADLGCGFSPFMLPFMSRLPASYTAFDISSETVALLNRFFALYTPSDYHAQPLDAVSTTPAGHYDVALLFKLLPLLRHQRKGRDTALLEELDFGTAIVSFPLRSLSGREKGMEAFYSSQFESSLPCSLRISGKAIFSNELFYAVVKNV